MIRKTLIALLALTALRVAATEPGYLPTDAERARWTMGDMRSWAIALDAYKMDNSVFPETNSIKTLRDAIQSKYIRVAPMHDAWGTPYRVESAKDGFRLVSAGADGKFDEASWETAARELASYGDDAVIDQSGKMMLRGWKYE